MSAAIISADIVSALIGRQIMTQAITDASSSIYSTLTGLLYYSNDIDNLLSELDLGNKIKILEQLTKELNNYKNKNTVVDMSLEHLHDMIIRIREDLKIIQKKLSNHKQKYFNKWRKVNCKKELANLTRHSNILDQRLELLFKSLEFTNKKILTEV